MMTSDTSLGGIEDRFRASLIAMQPSSLALNEESLPQKDPFFSIRKGVKSTLWATYMHSIDHTYWGSSGTYNVHFIHL